MAGDLVDEVERLSGEETLIICVSEGRREKDKAIREKQEQKFLKDVDALKLRADSGTLKPNMVHESIGQLKERYSRVARYYDMAFDEQTKQFTERENSEIYDILAMPHEPMPVRKSWRADATQYAKGEM